MTESHEAVALGLKGLHTSLKPEKALIFLYDGRTAGMSSQVAVGSHILAIACTEPGSDILTIQPL